MHFYLPVTQKNIPSVSGDTKKWIFSPLKGTRVPPVLTCTDKDSSRILQKDHFPTLQLLFLNDILLSGWHYMVTIRLAWFVLLLPVSVCYSYCKSGLLFAQYSAALKNNPAAVIYMH